MELGRGAVPALRVLTEPLWLFSGLMEVLSGIEMNDLALVSGSLRFAS